MSKFLKSLLISFCLLFAFTGITKATSLMIQGIDMPSWVNWEPIYISYTALETEGSPVEVKAFFKKDGEGWQQIGISDKLSDTFKVERSYFPGDGVYKIYFKETNSGQTTPEESFNIDFTAPSSVSEYRKDRKDANIYKICWKNPDNEDFDRVLIFRSEKTNEGFDKIAEVSGSKNEEKCYENGTPDNRDYYYLTRAIDHAGNASSAIGDNEVNTTAVGNVLGAIITPTIGQTLPLPVVDKQTVKEETQKEGEVGGAGATQAEEEKISQSNFMQNIFQQVIRLGWIRVIGIVIIFLGIVFLMVALLRKNRR